MASEDDSAMGVQAQHSPCLFPHDDQHDIITIDKYGDKYLEVGRNSCTIDANGHHTHTKAKTFRVCSKSLARASPVMEAMFSGRFREAHETHVSFPDDSPDLMDMLIRLAHGDTGALDGVNTIVRLYLEYHTQADPTYTFVDEFYELVVLADKYLMTQKLQQSVSKRIGRLGEWEDYMVDVLPHDDEDYHAHQRVEKSMWIACVFGDLELYQSLFPHLVRYRGKEDLFQEVMEPQGVADHVHWARLQELRGWLAPVHNAIRALATDTDPTDLYLCKQRRREDRQRCQADTLKIMTEHLQEMSLWPLPEAEDIAGQVSRYFDIEIEDIALGLGCLHEDCAIERNILRQISKARDRSYDENAVPPEPLREAMMLRASY
ncbi:hypothetical protein KJ359_005503 [Pestalotiopsis sp. 9143b]|nr:hypothetical protein KJ359_005503 [Pestalotiopsis sp. 9143b]